MTSNIDEKQAYFLQYYLPHVQVCAELISHYQIHSSEATRLLFQGGNFLYFHGFYHQSQAFHTQALDIRKQVLVPDHLAVAESLTALAMFASNQDNYEYAEQLYQQALDIREKILGPDNPETTRRKYWGLNIPIRSATVSI